MTSATLNRFGFGILIAGLLAALVLAGASLIPRHPPEEKQRQPSPEELDRLAKPYFDRAAANVPAAAQELSSAGNLAFLAYLMVWRPDSVQPYLETVLDSPILQPCRAGARVYGFDLNTAAFLTGLKNSGAEYADASLQAAGGLVLESLFLKPTLAAFHRVTGSCAALLAGSWGSGAACAAVDGPLLICDIAGLMIAAGGAAVCGSELWQARITLPQELSTGLYRAIRECRELCRKEVRR
ncbi:hypothetical protein [Victivallis lenta]|uniref:hypothetical protein n=1 Tax=Victivallis lenta TaxID=2606640 RepID=UPI0015A84E64|nr:hypothetical protein [Victivallis lenta]DAG92388.1 MAG TPA: hypothetical protein [Herelleviridae sp.]